MHERSVPFPMGIGRKRARAVKEMPMKRTLLWAGIGADYGQLVGYREGIRLVTFI